MLPILVFLIILVLSIVRLLFVAQKWLGEERTLLGVNIMALVFVVLALLTILTLGGRA